MGKKNRNKKNKKLAGRQHNPGAANSAIITRKPEFSAFWLAVIIPVICLVGAWSFPPVATPMELKSYTSQIYLSALLFLWLWMQRNTRAPKLEFSPARIAFGLLFIAGTLSLIWAVNPDFWVYKWNKWFAGFVMFILALQVLQNEKNLDTIVNLVLLGALITACVGIGQYLFNIQVIPQTAFPASTFGNGNMAGQVMVLSGLLPLYFLFKKQLTSSKIWLYALGMALLFVFAFYTRTRAVWIACTFEIFLLSLFIILDRKKRATWLFWSREKTFALLSAIGLFFILINFNRNGFQPFWSIAAREISSIATSIGSSAAEGEHRYLIWTAVSEMIKNNPLFGTGLGSFFHNYNTGGYANYNIMGVQRVHNDVLELAVELGALGILFLLGIIITMCTLLVKLFLHCEGYKRSLFALLTIVVTGSMLNAQVSFPYQLPVPNVIMPFFVALLIKGSEDLDNKIYTITLKPFINRAATWLAGLVFTFLLINDLTWMRDIHQLNLIVSRQVTGTAWKPVNPIFNQAYITGGRSVNQALTRVGDNQLALLVVEPLVEYWPNSAANTLLPAENHLNLRQHEESAYWAKLTMETQPEGTYIGEYYLMQIYLRDNDIDKLRELYLSILDDPESLLNQQSNTYNILHSMSINVGDFENTTILYNKFKEYFGEVGSVEANQAVFYINTGNIPAAVPYMRRALELVPDLALADTFNQLLMQYPE